MGQMAIQTTGTLQWPLMIKAMFIVLVKAQQEVVSIMWECFLSFVA